MNTILVITFLIYVAFLIALGWFVSRKQTTADEFLLGGRRLPLLLTLGTTVATMVGTGSSMGAVGFAYQFGWAGTLYGIGGSIGIILLAKLFASVRKYRFMTMSEELSFYVGANSFIKNLVAIIIYVASVGWLGAHIIGGGLYLSWLLEIDPNIAKVIVASSFAIYVIIGGYTAVVWTDSIQAIILFCGFILMGIFCIDYLGGINELKYLGEYVPKDLSINDHLKAERKIDLIPAISLMLVVLVGILATPSFRQRIYSGKDISSVKKSFYISGVLYLLFSSIPAIIGMVAYKANPDLKNQFYAFPYIALNLMPVWLGAILVISGLSATLSSASSDAIAAVSVVLRDIYFVVFKKMPSPNRVLMLSRVNLFTTISLALVLALSSDDIIGYITKMIAMLMSGICVTGLLGRYWKRFNWQGAFASLVAGSTTAAAIIINAEWSDYWGNPIIPSLTASLLSAIIISLLTKQNPLTEQESLDILNKQRSEMEYT